MIQARKLDFNTLQDIFYFNFYNRSNYTETQGNTVTDMVNLPRTIANNEECLVFASKQNWVVVSGLTIQSNRTQVKVNSNCVVNSAACSYSLSAIYFPTQ